MLLCLARPISLPLYPKTIVNDNSVRQIYHQFEWFHVLLRFIWIVSQTWIHLAHETFSSSYLLSMEVLRELRHCLQVEMGKTFGVWGICGMGHLRVHFRLVIKSSLGVNSWQSNNRDAVPFMWFSMNWTIMILAWRERLKTRELGRLFFVIMTSGLTATGMLESGAHGNLRQNMQLDCKQL